MSDSRTDGTALFVFLAGAVIGVGVGLLVAPKTGSETRKQIADLAHKAQEKASDIKNRLTTTVSDVADNIRERKGA